MKWPLRLGLVWVLGSTACSYTPEHDFDVVSSWLVNGAVPDSSRCSELGIDRMRVELESVGDPVIYEGPCDQLYVLSDGLVYGGLQTGLSFDYGVPYTYSVTAVGKNGRELFGYDSTFTAYYDNGTSIELDTVDVFEPRGKTATFSAVWRFSTGVLSDDCKANEVEKVAVLLASRADPSFENPVQVFKLACAKGTYDSGPSRILAQGDYLAKYIAFDSRGAVAEQSEPYSFVVEKNTHAIELDRHKFEGL